MVIHGIARLAWDVGEARGAAAIQRRTGDQDWVTLASVSAAGRGVIAYEDATVLPGSRYRYRLELSIGSSTLYTGESEIVVPAAAAFALEGALPNPATLEFAVAFTLADATPATLELLDLAGRAVVRLPLGALTPGRHVEMLGGARVIPPGIYFVRLTQRERSLVSRVAIMP